MKLMDAPWRRQVATAACGFAVIFSQSPAQGQFYGGWVLILFPCCPCRRRLSIREQRSRAISQFRRGNTFTRSLASILEGPGKSRPIWKSLADETPRSARGNCPGLCLSGVFILLEFYHRRNPTNYRGLFWRIIPFIVNYRFASHSRPPACHTYCRGRRYRDDDLGEAPTVGFRTNYAKGR